MINCPFLQKKQKKILHLEETVIQLEYEQVGNVSFC